MRSKHGRPADAIARLFYDVAGEVPDDASLLRMRRISNVLRLRDNDALWSVMAILEYYTRLYEAIPDRMRRAGESSLDSVRREAEVATDALMQQHRDALARCKETIVLAKEMTQEHEADYRAALAKLNDASLDALTERLASRVMRTSGNRLIGAAAISAREQRERLDGAITIFSQAVDATVLRMTEVTAQWERRALRMQVRIAWISGSVLLALLIVIGVAIGRRWGF